MKKGFYKTCIAMLFISAIAVTSCKDDDDDQNYALSNQEFVTRAASSNNFEIAAGGLAVNRAENAAVKHYGEHMVTDHSAAGMEMKNLASSKGWSVPDALQPNEQQNLVTLSGLNGAAFDREFAKIMVMSHQDAVELFATAESTMGVPDPDLRAFASAKLPTLRAHLQEATNLSAAVVQ